MCCAVLCAAALCTTRCCVLRGALHRFFFRQAAGSATFAPVPQECAACAVRLDSSTDSATPCLPGKVRRLVQMLLGKSLNAEHTTR